MLSPFLCDAQSDYLFQLPSNHVAHFRCCVLTEMGGGLGSQTETEPGVELFFACAYFMAVELQEVVRATNVRVEAESIDLYISLCG